jgi:ESCRT-II complex subunit VPS36
MSISPLHDTICALNPEGTPLLKQNEIVYRIPPSVSLYRHDEKVEKDGVLYVTSHRLIWADTLRTRARQWSLSQIEGEPRLEAKGLLTLFSTPKIIIDFIAPPQTKVETAAASTTPKMDVSSSVYPSLLSSSTGTNPSTYTSATAGNKKVVVEVKIACGENAHSSVFDDIRSALQRKAWKEEDQEGTTANSTSSAVFPTSSTTRAGVAGIVEAESREKIASRALAAEALQGDLASLEKHAKKMVALAENYAIEVEKARIRKAAAAAATDSSSSSSSSASIESDEAWNQQMQNVGTLAAGMGIVSPVTKSIAGSGYTSELARQISVVLRPHLQRRGGVISLTDTFCLVNRARGTEVVSPEDLFEASQLLEDLKLGMRMTSIAVENNEQGKGGKGGGGGSGGGSFRAIQLDTFSDAAVTSRILKLFDERKDNVETRGEHYYPFVTAHEITKLMGIPLPFVKQILLQAEKNAILCRDESIAGLRFFKNLMVSL